MAMACSAWWSVSGPWASETNASMPWVSASRPVAAPSASDIVVSRRGSITETSGTSARPMMVIFVCRTVSVTMQNCETSAPVPDVDGIMISGGMGCSMRSMPSKSRMRPPLAASSATPLAASMTEPPPMPSTTSQPASR